MKKWTVAAVAATTLGLTAIGVGAASAIGDNAPEWAPQNGQYQAFGNGAGNGTGDPTTCPYYDGTGDQVQERTREHAQVKDQSQLRDRTADQTQQQDRLRIHQVS